MEAAGRCCEVAVGIRSPGSYAGSRCGRMSPGEFSGPPTEVFSTPRLCRVRINPDFSFRIVPGGGFDVRWNAVSVRAPYPGSKMGFVSAQKFPIRGKTEQKSAGGGFLSLKSCAANKK